MKNLSTPLTFLYKCWGLLWILLTVTVVILFINGTGNLWGLVMLLMIVPFIGLINTHQIKYDENYVYLKKWSKSERVELTKVKSINEGDLFSLDPYFELEIIDDQGELRKINFLPGVIESLHYFFTKRQIGQLMDFKIKVRNLKNG